MSRSDYEAQVGRVLRGKWTLERLLGVGGMAAVYAGRHKIGRTAAIKILHAEVAMDAQVRARFEQEALAVNSVGHKGVVEIIDIDTTDDGSLFLVMELLEGETLADRVERKGLMREKAMLDIVDEVLDVLIACHGKDIVHRDIKPENLYLPQDGGVKVLDFGIARVRAGVKTIAGTMLGTVAFMPPEQVKGTEVDARADLFAVGATMFTCIAGRRIHDATSDAQLATRMLTRAAPRFAAVHPDASEGLALLIDRALAFLPERRYPDALTMRGDLWAVRRGQRPPYAKACEHAGQSPRALTLSPTRGAATKPDAQPPVESTRPQMPVFVDIDDDADASGSQAAQPVAATRPQMPVFEDQRGEGDPPASPDAPSSAPPSSPSSPPSSSQGPPSSKAPSSLASPDAASPDSAGPDSAIPVSMPPSSQPPAVLKRRDDEAPAGGGAGWTILAVVLALLAAGLLAAWQLGLIDQSKLPR